MISHYIHCDECQAHQPCEIARMLVASHDSSAEQLQGSSGSMSTLRGGRERVCMSEPELTRHQDL